MNYPKDRSVLVVRKKFFRKRKCENADCMQPFDPLNPTAKCCCEGCRNRKGYLRRKAIKNGIPPDDVNSIWNYSVLQCLLDQGVTRPTLDFLKAYNFVFPKNNIFEVVPVGDLVLVPIENEPYIIMNHGKY